MNSPRLLIWIVAAVMLAGCQADRTEDLPVPEDEALQAGGLVRGEAYYLDRIAMPAESYLTVRLLDAGIADLARAQRAETTLKDVGNPPYRFELAYDPAAVSPERDYVLVAALYGPDERTWFTTAEPVPVDLSGDRRVEFRLSQVGVAEPDDLAAMPVRGRAYQCNDIRLEARHVADGSIVLVLPWADLRLPVAAAGARARFSDGVNEFRTRGEVGARLSLAGREAIECVVTETRSPWAAAADRDVAFRAAGNEPGWSAEVDRGETPAIRLSLDHGTHHLEFEAAEALEETAGYRADSAGNVAELRLASEACTDSMSGHRFPVRVLLTVNEQQLEGCGRYLAEQQIPPPAQGPP